MATEASVIEQVRRRVADHKETRTYADHYYQDAIGFSLGKLSHDVGTSYSTVSDVPVGRVFLLVKLAAIEMCYIRAANEVDGDCDSLGGGDISQISVPDLSVSGSDTSEYQAATVWLTLAQRLQNEYDGELQHSGGASQAAEIQVGSLHRISLTHGGIANRRLDSGLSAVSVSASVSGTVVTLQWDTLYADDFMRYEVYRDSVPTMVDEERIAIIDDNHTVVYDDEGLSSGTYYYRVKTVNPNDLKTNSNVEEAVVT